MRYTEPIKCEVCGVEGETLAGRSWRQWIGAFFSHRDPRVCAENLKLTRER